MPKLKRLVTKFKDDEVIITAHRYAARGRYAVECQIKCPRRDLKSVLVDPVVQKKLLFKQSTQEANG
jgi:hypothetical protein